MKQNLALSIIAAVLIVGLGILGFFYITESQQSSEVVLYYTKEYLTQESVKYTFYDYNVQSLEKKSFLTLEGDTFREPMPQLVGDKIYVRQKNAIGESANSSILIRYNIKGEEVDRLILPENDLDGFLIGNSDDRIAYDWVDKINNNMADGPWYDGAKWRITIHDYTTEEDIILKAEDFVYENREMKYVRPLAFDGSTFYFIASPHTSFDIGSPMIIYKMDIQTRQNTVLTETGTPVQDIEAEFNAETYEKMVREVFLYNQILPVHNILLLEKGIATPREVYSLSLQNGVLERILDLETIGGNAWLATSLDAFGPISPDGRKLILHRASYNEGFAILDLPSNKLDKDFFPRGDFVAWVSHNTVLYENYRNERWDDKYNSLYLLNTDTKEEQIIYTQTTNHVEGANLTSIGDMYYSFLGVIRGEE